MVNSTRKKQLIVAGALCLADIDAFGESGSFLELLGLCVQELAVVTS